jgi:hypothetical protein
MGLFSEESVDGTTAGMLSATLDEMDSDGSGLKVWFAHKIVFTHFLQAALCS